MKIIKRDGRIVDFDESKITEAICKAMEETELGVDLPLALQISRKIFNRYNSSGFIEDIPNVENVQDDVETELMYSHRTDVAKRYILYREKRNEIRKDPWNMNELQRDIWESKYQHDGESFNEFINRVSGGNPEVAKLIRDQDFLFGGRILAGRGLDRNISLSNCYVMPRVEDNLESIFDTAGKLARTYSYGGGCGLSLSKLRPNGSPVNNSAETTTGPVSFMELYSTTTDIIGQRGRRKIA